jgi:hypothetical protein
MEVIELDPDDDNELIELDQLSSFDGLQSSSGGTSHHHLVTL